MSARRAGKASAADEGAPDDAAEGVAAVEVATPDGAVADGGALGDGSVVGPGDVGTDGVADELHGAGTEPFTGADASGELDAEVGGDAPAEAEGDASEVWSRSNLPGEDAAGEEVDDSLGAWPDTQLQMRFVEVAMVLPSTNPVVVLEEIDPPRRQLLIPVGTPEGVAIAYAARRIPTPKPLTHELFTDVLESFTLTLEVVRITDVDGTAFSAELVLAGPSGTRVVACRPSDGIALALRQRLPAPITTAAEVLDRAGVGTADG